MSCYPMLVHYCTVKRQIIASLIDDSIQDGVFGLMRAAEKYKPDDCRFSTYAMFWIRAAVNQRTPINVPVHVPAYVRDLMVLPDEQLTENERVLAKKGRDAFQSINLENPDEIRKEPTFECDLERTEMKMILQEVIAGFREKERIAINMRIDGCNHAQIAHRIGIAEWRIQQILESCYDRIREEMDI